MKTLEERLTSQYRKITAERATKIWRGFDRVASYVRREGNFLMTQRYDPSRPYALAFWELLNTETGEISYYEW